MMRADANLNNRKSMTALKLLNLAQQMVQKLRKKADGSYLVGEDKENKDDIVLRQEAIVIPLDVLEQKVYFKQGMLQKNLNNNEKAIPLFLQSINCGTLFDARVKKACIEQLLKMVNERSHLIPQLNLIL